MKKTQKEQNRFNLTGDLKVEALSAEFCGLQSEVFLYGVKKQPYSFSIVQGNIN